MRVAVEEPFGCKKAFNAYGASGMQAACANADFGSETKSVSVGHARTSIVEDAGTINILHELGRNLA